MTQRIFIDNLDGNTLEKALANSLSSSKQPPSEVRIATGFFTTSGLSKIAKYLINVPNVRLMLGVDLGSSVMQEKKPFDENPEQFEQRRLRSALIQADEILNYESTIAPFTRISRNSILDLLTSLESGNLQVRRYEKAFLHAKAYIIGTTKPSDNDTHKIIVGSSNLTVAGLNTNLELNVARDDVTTFQRATEWFDALWVDAKQYDLTEFFTSLLKPQIPWLIFLRVLWRLYGSEVEDEIREDGNFPLTSFQKHGVARALRLIRETGGAIIADEVGLGKTFIAGEIVRVYSDRRQRSLVVCPAAVRDTIWQNFIGTYELFIECVSFEQLSMDAQLHDNIHSFSVQQHLIRPLDEYQLVIVDEAHNYRNPDTPTRARTLRRLLRGKPRDLLLLTATPVNNSLWDLYQLLDYFKAALKIRLIYLSKYDK